MAAAQQWRTDMGLRSDAAWVEQVNRDHPERPTTWAYPVTAEEHAGLMSRSGQYGDAWRDVTSYAQRFPDTFGGAWGDPSAQGRIVVAFTADVGARRRELDAIVGDRAPLAVVQAKTSLAELKRLSDEFNSWSQSRGLAGGWGTQEDIGVLQIDLYVRDEPSVRAVADRFGDRPICIAGPAPKDLGPEGPHYWRD